MSERVYSNGGFVEVKAGHVGPVFKEDVVKDLRSSPSGRRRDAKPVADAVEVTPDPEPLTVETIGSLPEAELIELAGLTKAKFAKAAGVKPAEVAALKTAVDERLAALADTDTE